jgi:branched-chain amino acid transport system substrate-binding protein
MDAELPGADRSDINYAYGYNVSKLLHHTLQNCKDMTRKGIMGCAANIQGLQLPMVLPGITVNTSATDFYPIQAEQLSKFDGQKWVLFGNIIDASK